MHHSRKELGNKSFVQNFILSFLTLGAIISFVYLFQSYHSLITQAQENSLTFKIKLQGESYPLTTIKTKIVVYRSLGKVKEYDDVIFTYGDDKIFVGTITLDTNFDYNAFYAVYIKPQKYFGKLFCSDSINSKDCTIPQFIFKQSGNMIDLSSKLFSGGDIDPINGRVDAYDISKIISNLGKSSDTSTDINNDGITNTIDYLLALYSLSNNLSDDAYTLIVPWAPTPTASIPTVTPFIPTPTFPFPTNQPPTRCSYCTTAACGQCSNYARGWRCKCTGFNGSTYSSCVGILDSTCGSAQPTP